MEGSRFKGKKKEQRGRYSLFKESLLEASMRHFQLNFTDQNSAMYQHSAGKECEKCYHSG